MFSSLISSFQTQCRGLQDNGSIFVTMDEGRVWEKENISICNVHLLVPRLDPQHGGRDQPSKYPQWYRQCRGKTRIHGVVPNSAGLRLREAGDK